MAQKLLAHRISQIAEGFAAGDMTQDDAADFLAVARQSRGGRYRHGGGAGARGAAQKIIDAALAGAQMAINKRVGFALVQFRATAARRNQSRTARL